MELSVLKNQIKSGRISGLYIFTGDEVKVMDIYIGMMSKASKLPVERCDSINEAFQRSASHSLIQTKCLYLVRDDVDFMQNESAWRNVVNTSAVIVLYCTNIDKRTKFWKRFAERVVVFEHLSEDILTKYIQKDVRLSSENCHELIAACESDYGRILLELDKVKAYAGPDSIDTSFRHLMGAGAIYRPPDDAIFDFVAAVLNRDARSALRLYGECVACGEASLVMLSVLHNNARQLLQVQSCIDGGHSSDICGQTGLTGFQVKCVSPYVHRYKNRELISMMETVHKMEIGIKTGEVDEGVSVLYTILSCM